MNSEDQIPPIPSQILTPEIPTTEIPMEQKPHTPKPIERPITQEPPKPKGKIALVLVIFLIFVVLGSLGYWVYQNYLASPKSNSEVSTPTPMAKASEEILQFSLPEPPYSVVISGEIEKGDTSIKLNPFFFVTSTFKDKNEKLPSDAQFKILLKKNGNVFYEEPLNAAECVDFSPGDYCGKYDNSYGFFVHGIYGLSELPDEIVIQHLGKDIYTLREPINQFPSLALVSQEYTEDLITISWGKKTQNVKLNYCAYVSNNNFQTVDSSALTKSVFLSEDNSNNDGSSVFNDNTFTFSPKGFIEGDLQVAIYATDGFRTYVAYSDKFTTQKSQVEAKIKMPENGITYNQTAVPLEAESFDPRTGLRCGGCEDEGNTYIWTSNLNGIISNKHDTYCQFLTPGDHKITLQVKNLNGTEASTSVNIKVNPVSIISEAETKNRQQKGETCY